MLAAGLMLSGDTSTGMVLLADAYLPDIQCILEKIQCRQAVKLMKRDKYTMQLGSIYNAL